MLTKKTRRTVGRMTLTCRMDDNTPVRVTYSPPLTMLSSLELPALFQTVMMNESLQHCTFFSIEHFLLTDGLSSKTQCKASWELLCSHIPNFCTEMVMLADQRKLRRRVARKVWLPFLFSLFCFTALQIGEGVHNVRAEDASSLKNMILDYLLVDPTAQLIPPIKSRGKKADCGFQHPITVALLCPLKYDATQQ